MARTGRTIGVVNVNREGNPVSYIDEVAQKRIKELEEQLKELSKENAVLKVRTAQAEARLRARDFIAA